MFVHGDAGLGAANPPPVKLGACRAVSQLCPNLPADLLKPCLPELLTSLTLLLKESREGTQNLVLETLAVVVKVRPKLGRPRWHLPHSSVLAI